jgi:uncharacterized membrane protein SpoIIM required for sporulation
MRLDLFIQQRQTEWQRLEALTQQAKSNAESLSSGELYELGRLYRVATSDLALAQREFPNQQVTIYLNQLVGRSHALIYREEPLHIQQLRDFYREKFPRLFRHLLPYTAIAFALFMAPAVLAFILVWFDPERIYTFLGSGPEVRRLVSTVEDGQLWTEIAPSVRSAASAAILTNNIGVMFIAFAGSMTGGLLTLYIMLLNGINIGAIFGLLQAHGLSGGLAEFVAAHGPIEVSVIFLSGGCGLYVADGLLRPGLLSRKDALAQRARLAVQLILGSVPLLVLAGIIEGFISPSGLPWIVKAAVGIATGAALLWYWFRGGSQGAEA